MMNSLRISGLVAAITLGSIATAQDMPEDTDGDGVYSMAELKAAFPDLSEEGFVSIDANGDGVVDGAELAEGMASGAFGG